LIVQYGQYRGSCSSLKMLMTIFRIRQDCRSQNTRFLCQSGMVALHCWLGESFLCSSTHSSPAIIKNVRALVIRDSLWFCFGEAYRSPESRNTSPKPLFMMSCATMNRGRPEELQARRSRTSKADFMPLNTIVGLPTTSRYITSPSFP